MNFLKNKFKRNWIFTVLLILVVALVIIQHLQYMPFLQENFDNSLMNNNISNVGDKNYDLKMPDNLKNYDNLKMPDEKISIRKNPDERKPIKKSYNDINIP